MDIFEEYIRQGEPSRKKKAEAWNIATGLQAVDGLKTSGYLHETASKHIEGDIDIEEVKQLLRSYYKSKTARTPKIDDEEEADLVSANIANILSRQTLAFSVVGYTSTHRRIFEGVFKHAGKVRDYDITKKEFVLRGDTVNYLNYEDIRRALEYDIQQEKDFDYIGLSKDEIIQHICAFTSGIWQIHAFREGNTRTTAVFVIQYLRSLGFEVNNDVFADNSWYFRNALVRANYNNAIKGIRKEPVYLERFFRNLLLGEKNELKNRYMIINPPEEWKEGLDNPLSPDNLPDNLPDKFYTNNGYIVKLVKVIGSGKLSVKDMLKELCLKDRESFLKTYLTTAMSEGFVTTLYPDNPHHPRQKYHLTVKGLGLWKEVLKQEERNSE